MFQGIQMFIYILGGNRNRRLGNQHRAPHHRRQYCQFFTDSFRKSRPTQQTIGYVCTDLHPAFHQLLLGQSQSKDLIHAIQHSRSIGTSTCHPCRHGNPLTQPDPNTRRDSELLCQKPGCPDTKVIIIHRQMTRIGGHGNSVFVLTLGHCHQIIQMNRLHNHTHQMVAVISCARHIQTDINLSKRLHCYLIHIYSPPDSSERI